jgi:TP901 family phage tail tape measure protein
MTGVNLGTLFASLLLEDDFTGTFQKFLTQQDNAQKKAQDVSNGFKAMGVAAAAFGAASIGAANDLNKSMANVATIIPDNRKRIDELKSSVQDLSLELGKSTGDLAQGLYELVSSLGDTADNVKILEINAKAASAGLATTQDAINFTTAVTKTYGDTSAEAFQKVSDLGFQAVNLGKTTFPELAHSIGSVAPLAKETGVSMEELFAIVATATGVTGNTNEVMTQMSSIITGLVSPTKELREVYDKLGIVSGEALIKQKGLVGAIQTVAKAAKDAQTPLIDLVGRKEAWIIASSLAGSQAENFSQKLKAMSNVVGATDQAFRNQTEGIAASAHQWDLWKASINVSLQKTGDTLLNTLGPTLGTVAIGFSELGGKALASAGEISQVALAARALGGGQILSSISNLTSGLTGIVSAASLARAGLIGVGIAITGWTLYKVSEAIGLIDELNKQVGNAQKDATEGQRMALQAITAAHDKTGIAVRNHAEALQVLNAYSAGLRGEMLKQGEVTQQMVEANKKGLEVGGKLIDMTKVKVMLTGEDSKATLDLTAKHNGLVEQLSAVRNEMSHFTDAQKQGVKAGVELNKNAQEIQVELNKIPGATRVSVDAVQLFMNSLKDGASESKHLTKELEDLKKQFLGFGDIKDAVDLSKILGGADVEKLSPAKLGNAFDTVKNGLDAISRVGMDAAKVTDDQVVALVELRDALEKASKYEYDWNDAMKKVASDGVKKVSDRVDHFTESMEDLQKKLKKAKDQLNDRQFTQGLSDNFRDLVTKTHDYISQLEDMDDEIANETNPALQAMQKALRDVKAQDMSTELGEMVIKTDEFRDVLLTIVPLFPSFTGMINDFGKESETTTPKVKHLRGEVESLKDAFTGDTGAKFIQGLFDSIAKGFTEGSKLSDILKTAGQQITSQLAKGIGASVSTSFGGGASGAIAGAAAGFIVTAIAQGIYDYATAANTKADLKRAADAMRTQLIDQFASGSKEAFVKMLQAAGISQAQINLLFASGDPNTLAHNWAFATDQLTKYKAELDGLNKMAGGAALIGQSLGMKLDKSKTEQDKPFKAMQDAAIEAMKQTGATSDEIDKQLAAFAEQNKNRVYQATEDQIAQYNRLGTIVGGTIANMAGRTGDLIGAILANKDALQQLADAQKSFGLGEQTNAATQEVLNLYKTITDNPEVIASIQGTTQSLTGMGDAMLQNAELSNAFGDELAADIAALEAQGVSAQEAYALAAPGLQKLWELEQTGKVVLDDTTKAMLDQAEKQGVVGENMRSVNEQVLDVLKEIRDMFSKELPAAIPRTTAAAQTAAGAQQRAAAATATAWKDSGRSMTEEQRKAYEIFVRESETAANDVKNNLSKIPKDFPIDIDWKVPKLELPDPDKVEIPVIWKYPDGETPRMPWDEGGPYGPGGPKSTGYQNAGTATPASAVDGGRGSQTIVVERDGQKDLQFTAENLPDYVRIRAGSTVIGV